MVSARLVAAARDAFARHGYAGVNVADICSAADVAKGTFYRYFDSKEAIFLAAARSTVEAVGEQLDELPAPMSEHQAIEKLKLLLGPLAPLLLEVATGELRHQPNLVGVVGVISAGLASPRGTEIAHKRKGRQASSPPGRRRRTRGPFAADASVCLEFAVELGLISCGARRGRLWAQTHLASDVPAAHRALCSLRRRSGRDLTPDSRPPQSWYPLTGAAVHV